MQELECGVTWAIYTKPGYSSQKTVAFPSEKEQKTTTAHSCRNISSQKNRLASRNMSKPPVPRVLSIEYLTTTNGSLWSLFERFKVASTKKTKLNWGLCRETRRDCYNWSKKTIPLRGRVSSRPVVDLANLWLNSSKFEFLQGYIHRSLHRSHLNYHRERPSLH
jgi:hypothetical protein